MWAEILEMERAAISRGGAAHRNQRLAGKSLRKGHKDREGKRRNIAQRPRAAEVFRTENFTENAQLLIQYRGGLIAIFAPGLGC